MRAWGAFLNTYSMSGREGDIMENSGKRFKSCEENFFSINFKPNSEGGSGNTFYICFGWPPLQKIRKYVYLNF